MRLTVSLFVGMALLLGMACGSKGKVLGKTPKAPDSTVLAINAGDAPANLSLQGTIVEKCPQAGCWFRLDDGTGVIKVDTKAANFVVLDVPLQTKVKVSGKVTRVGDIPELQATGLQY